MFNEWDQLVVRLDIWRFATGLYCLFMQQRSVCIFEWDAGDVRRLLEAKRSELEGKHGMVGLTEVSRQIDRKEMALHCRRCTRLDPLKRRGSTPWASRCWTPSASRQSGKSKRHHHCIQDQPETGKITNGGVILPVYRCARALESFHHNRFIPGTRANAMHFGGTRAMCKQQWRERLSYSGHLQHILNLSSRRVLCKDQVKDYTKPSEYTGKLSKRMNIYTNPDRT